MTLMQFDVAAMARNLATVMAVALVLGAGVPAIFALGMRATTLGRTVSADGHVETGTMSMSGRVLSTLCFGVVLVAVVLGIAFIVAGKQIMAQL
ncbi:MULTISPECIES: hypothetical protein [Aestuariimicrobium]|uniref:hypothetical protein n=1 Tax=Aestuariimicrobium TaxID=396388 RepID=UPI0004174971|nr:MULTISPECIES: hypothetical protein [Aestuariimicrobium]CAI9404014.1 hypothetical protein AESSP_01122 [Aestuariimicrobium sp. T2.26MG-19.2B]